MSDKEIPEFKKSFIQEQYELYGDRISTKIPKMTKENVRSAIEELKEENNMVLPKVQYNSATNNPHMSEQNSSWKCLDLAISTLGDDDRQLIFEVSKNMPDPKHLIDNAISIQHLRISKGLERERTTDSLNEETEIAINNLVSMIEAKQKIEEGSELNINVKNNLGSLIEQAVLEEEKSEINYGENNK